MKNFREFMEDMNSPDQKSSGNRVDAAKQRFEAQKEKAKQEIISTREKVKSSKERSASPLNKQKSVKLNKSTGQLPSFNKKEEK